MGGIWLDNECFAFSVGVDEGSWNQIQFRNRLCVRHSKGLFVDSFDWSPHLKVRQWDLLQRFWIAMYIGGVFMAGSWCLR
jgi:hypothetical protein